GTGTPVLQFVSRTGQLMNVDLFDSKTNYNLNIYAQSGSGKSFLSNEIIRAYLSTGNKAWAIDAGESYKKLSQSLGGTFTTFD
ncbi:type IV secretion system protein TraC, partial [Vibrio breoganii]